MRGAMRLRLPGLLPASYTKPAGPYLTGRHLQWLAELLRASDQMAERIATREAIRRARLHRSQQLRITPMAKILEVLPDGTVIDVEQAQEPTALQQFKAGLVIGGVSAALALVAQKWLQAAQKNRRR